MNGLGRPSVRAVVYTRKSSEEGLEQEFNSLDAQYEHRRRSLLSVCKVFLPDNFQFLLLFSLKSIIFISNATKL